MPETTPPPVPHAAETGEPEVDRLLGEGWAGMPDRPDLLVSRAEEALAVASGDRARAHALGAAGFGLYLRSDHEAALERFSAALALMESLGDLNGRAMVLSGMAGARVSLGHFEEALGLALETLAAARTLGDRDREAWMLVGLGNTYLDLGDCDRAMASGEAALRLFGELREPAGQARAHGVIGGALRSLGRAPEALAHHESALRLSRETGVRLSEARALHDIGECDHDAGDYDAALGRHQEALALRRAVGNRQAESASLLHVGLALAALGRTPEAVDALTDAHALATAVGAEPRVAEVDRALAEAHEASGDAARALAHHKRYHACREALLDAQSRSRIHSLQVRAEAEQAQREAEIAHLRSVELAAALDDVRRTQRRLVQQEKLASLGRLASGVSHEIQNPLNFIANFAGLNADYADEMREAVEARRAEIPDDLADDLAELLTHLAENIGRVRDHARRASGIVKSLVGHGRPASGQRQRLDMRDLVGRAVEVTLAGSGIRPVWVPGAEPVTVEADAQALDRALVNLVDNARRAVQDRADADEGFRPLVCVALDRVEDHAVLRVMDNGDGVPEDLRDRVFEPFFSTRPTGEGTGLGLPLARQIVVDGHGGALDLEPTEAGAAFTIRLPLAPAEGGGEKSEG